MIELIFVACLAASPADCIERNMIYHGITPMTCMMGGQAELARWADRHPGHTISRWSCRPLRLRAREI